MTEILSTVFVAAIAFAACNIGELFILMSFYLDRRFSTTEVVTGQYVSATALVVLCLVIAFGFTAFSPEWLRFLGILPIAIGIKNLMQARTLLRQELREEKTTVRHMGINLLSVTAVTFADGSDNVGVFAPLFAHQSALQVSITVAVFIVLIGVWCWAAHYLLHHEKLGRHIRRWGVYIAPIALIIIGLVILFK